MISLTKILSEVNWKAVDDESVTKYKEKELKSSKVLKKMSKDGYTYYLTDYGTDFDDIFLGQIYVFSDDGQFVAENGIAKWNGESDEYMESLVSVHPDHRRKRIATNMYNMAERYFKKKFKPAPSKTSDAEKFWKNRNKKIR